MAGTRTHPILPASQGLTTHFAAAGRADPTRIERVARVFAEHPLALAILDAADVLLMVLTPERQIVAANEPLRALLGERDIHELCGLRTGELLGCIHAGDVPGGCGTARHCGACGSVLAVLESQRSGTAIARDCLMTVLHDGVEEAREFRVKATPLCLDGESLTVVSLRDISAEKRRDALEHVFLHDLMNTLGGLFGWSSLLRDSVAGEERDIADRIYLLGQRLRDEVADHRTLLLAEEGALEPALEDTTADGVLRDVERVFRQHAAARERHISVRADDAGRVRTDRALLGRVIGNMLKNALEATPEGGHVVAWSEGDRETCRIAVWNAGAMPPAVQLQVFRRSFSTKAPRGRGLGTFGMKLFGERYLGGRVTFTSNEEDGTTFSILLPRTGPRARARA